jgi:hydroxymethylpyrimidine pyrophosphatase-like HAD family hydrolase
MNVFFDVLDTLLTEEDIPRPHAREVVPELRERGHEVYLWSRACYEL